MSQWPNHDSDHARVYSWLKAATVNYRFRPGEQLMISELADRLRVSSTLIRESLIRLQVEELLDNVPRRGFFAKTLNLKEMIDLTQFRFVILNSSVERAVASSDNLNPSPLTRLAPGPGSPNGNTSPQGASGATPLDQTHDHVRLVEKAWKEIVALSQNDAVMRAFINVCDRTHYVRMIDFESAGRLGSEQSLLNEMLKALERKSASSAVTILKDSLADQVASMPALVKEGISRAYIMPPPFGDPPQMGFSSSSRGSPRIMNVRR